MNAIKIKERLKYYNILSIKYEENENNYYQGSLILYNEKKYIFALCFNEN